ncbi:MAG: DUF1614 domain-containing protein [Nitrospira sp.]|jgi:uncharacterized membrane protein|uniref:DUF1614 domain-containing protein n=1 Tax=Candidatus Nitrospira inopinata TaxID=1715989 RepID=A0A0S4KRE3_9BACT|nr:DUF1614 domain-containing protein [Candidatus Nitrospira inopinata]MCP9453283.1 DUF1614 domain-containing protein [Nitrospira sp.]MCP9465527.1 DUF1614 domain-containing protein [Nitrospira sp.]CUQ65897.1 conserved membrane protein of unknown function [Candidatus Nitrospira inopinata]
MKMGWLPLLFFFVLLVLLPLFFGHLFTAALIKLKLEPHTALLLVIGIFIGSLINIPVKRIARIEAVPVDPFAIFGLGGLWPAFQRVRRETVIAVNVGGCVIPTALAIYETVHLVMTGQQALVGLLFAVLINTMVCYWMAKPVQGVGITMPGLFPAVVASVSALLLVPDHAPPVAFVAGVLGPLIGADLLHLRDIEKIATGIASIGGAGTFDGIVLSGIMAAYLAGVDSVAQVSLNMGEGG